jgi:AcrR family transcriptional regulator
VPPRQPTADDPVTRVIDAAKRCCERWGFERVTVEDIAADAGVSRATLYRLFPGGKDILFEALRVRELEEFFSSLSAHLEGITDIEELAVQAAVHATRALRADDHLAVMMASEPGATLSSLTVSGLPRIVRIATVFLTPLVDPFLARREAAGFVEILARLVISYFLAPSDHVDLGDPDSARSFVRQFVMPAYLDTIVEREVAAPTV